MSTNCNHGLVPGARSHTSEVLCAPPVLDTVSYEPCYMTQEFATPTLHHFDIYTAIPPDHSTSSLYASSRASDRIPAGRPPQKLRMPSWPSPWCDHVSFPRLTVSLSTNGCSKPTHLRVRAPDPNSCRQMQQSSKHVKSSTRTGSFQSVSKCVA